MPADPSMDFLGLDPRVVAKPEHRQISRERRLYKRSQEAQTEGIAVEFAMIKTFEVKQ